jgi:hypothetical protein
MSENENKSEYYCVDRIEGEYAVIECPNGKMIDVKTEELPTGIKEGDCIKRINGKWFIDEEEKNRRLIKIKNLLNRIKK